MEEWEIQAKQACKELRDALQKAPRSKNINKIFDDFLTLQLRMAYQTGHYEEWGL